MARSSPTAARRSLARFLRESRKKAGISRGDVAAHVAKNPVTITRMEKAEVRAEVGTVAMLLELYEVPEEERPYFMELARAARKRGWWQRYSKGIPTWFSMYVGLEAEATEIWTYEPELMPGLLQTSDYTTALISSDAIPPAEEALERRVEVRQERQTRLVQSKTTRVWAIVNEGALYRQVGTPEIMRAQLQHLVTVSRRGNVTIQVLPFSAGAHPADNGPFVYLKFPDPRDRDLVYVEYRMGALYLEEPEELEAYGQVFEELKMRSVDRDTSISLLQAALDRAG